MFDVPYSADETGGGVRNYREPVVRKGARAPIMLRMFFPFSVVLLSVDCTNYPFQTNPKSPCN